MTIEQLPANDIADYIHQNIPELTEQELPELVFTAHIHWKQRNHGEPLLIDAQSYMLNGHRCLLRMSDTRMKPDTDFMPTEVIDFLDSFIQLLKHQQEGK